MRGLLIRSSAFHARFAGERLVQRRSSRLKSQHVPAGVAAVPSAGSPRRGDERSVVHIQSNAVIQFTFQTAKSCRQPIQPHHPYYLARPRVGPSSLCLPSKYEGDGAPRGATIVLDVPAFPLGNTGRRPARHPFHPGLFRRLPCCAGPRFSLTVSLALPGFPRLATVSGA